MGSGLCKVGTGSRKWDSGSGMRESRCRKWKVGSEKVGSKKWKVDSGMLEVGSGEKKRKEGRGSGE